MMDAPLPIDAVLDELRTHLAARTSAVLVAPPGAGKTTRVPLALMEEGWLQGRRILVLEPRRIAARAAAERMAWSLSEPVGERIGLRARMISKCGPRTRIEVVTEGVFTRMILDDLELSGVGAVLCRTGARPIARSSLRSRRTVSRMRRSSRHAAATKMPSTMALVTFQAVASVRVMLPMSL